MGQKKSSKVSPFRTPKELLNLKCLTFINIKNCLLGIFMQILFGCVDFLINKM